jgi:hypothetical protein
MRDWAENCFWQLLEGIGRTGYRGYDPYDGLNSRIIKTLRLDRRRLFARAFQQVMKRLPLNLRLLFLVPKGINPKGLALCLSALCRVPDKESVRQEAELLVRLLLNSRSPDLPVHCWGYNFRWESRLFSLPPYSPNAVCTVFAGEALLDAWLRFRWDICRAATRDATVFLHNHLNVTENENGLCFSYTTQDRSITHNINLMVTAFLYRAAKLLEQPEISHGLDQHLALTLHYQNEDGSWPYGEDRGNAWIDGIHQGFNLLALQQILICGDPDNSALEASLRQGYKFYIEKLFTPKGEPKYYSDHLFPIDIHSLAVAIIILKTLRELDDRSETLLGKVMNLCRNRFWMPQKQLFAYQQRRFLRVRIPYMRWNQCWMLSALAHYLYSAAAQ